MNFGQNISSPFTPRSLQMFSNSQKRTHESPMDWEWQTQGPTDPNSPFLQTKQQNQNSAFGQHSQSSFMNASAPAAPPFRNPSFTTPRKPFDQDMFSEVSGAESSPADNADAEDTPEPKSSKAMTAFTGGFSDKKPIFGKYGAGFAGFSPGREQRKNRFGNAVANKVRKRKRIDRDHAALIGIRGSESDSEEESRSKGRDQKHGGGQSVSWFSQLLHDIESHPNLPTVLSYYAQLALNFFFLCLAVFAVWTVWSTIKSDVDKASEEATAIVVAEMSKCARDYVDNGCAKTNRPPALEAVCDNWSHCMNRDPNSVGRAKVSAQTFAHIFNSFIEPISYKAMIFVVSILAMSVLVNNLAFSMFRAKAGHHMPTVPQYFPPHPQAFQWGQPPQTPQHTQGYDLYAGNTPFQQILPSQGLGDRSPSKSARSPSKGNRSPSKGDKY